jgi:hypothetical protein
MRLDLGRGMEHHSISPDIFSSEGGSTVSELTQLLLKAVRGLPDDERDKVIEELLEVSLGAGRVVELPREAVAGLPEQLPSRLFLGEPRLELLKGTPGAGESLTMVPARLSTEQHERLKQWCQANGFTMAVVLRGLVARFLDEQDRRKGGAATSAAE